MTWKVWARMLRNLAIWFVVALPFAPAAEMLVSAPSCVSRHEARPVVRLVFGPMFAPLAFVWGPIPDDGSPPLEGAAGVFETAGVLAVALTGALN